MQRLPHLPFVCYLYIYSWALTDWAVCYYHSQKQFDAAIIHDSCLLQSSAWKQFVTTFIHECCLLQILYESSLLNHYSWKQFVIVIILDSYLLPVIIHESGLLQSLFMKAVCCSHYSGKPFATILMHKFFFCWLQIEDQPDELDRKCQELAQMLQSAKNAIVYTGAGISTVSAIFCSHLISIFFHCSFRLFTVILHFMYVCV